VRGQIQRGCTPCRSVWARAARLRSRSPPAERHGAQLVARAQIWHRRSSAASQTCRVDPTIRRLGPRTARGRSAADLEQFERTRPHLCTCETPEPVTPLRPRGECLHYSLPAGLGSLSGSPDGPPIVAGGAVWALNWQSDQILGMNPTTGHTFIERPTGPLPHFATPGVGDRSVFVPTGNGVEAFRAIK